MARACVVAIPPPTPEAALSGIHQDLALLAEPFRVRLLCALQEEELSVGELVQVLQTPQSTVSRHVKGLIHRGWIRRRAEGSAAWLRVAPLDAPRQALWTLVRDALDPEERAQVQEDAERLRAVVAARAIDSRTFFGRIHTQWDALRSELFGTAFILPTLLGLLPEGLVVAELGCGTGSNLEALAPHVTRVIGVDREYRMLDAARHRTEGLPNVELRQGGLEDLPLNPAEVDAALCILVLHHIPDLKRAFSEIARVVRPGGKVVITDMRRHRRAAYRDTMGHAHLGFDHEDLCGVLPPSLTLTRYTALPPSPEARGPALFMALLHRSEQGPPRR